MPRGSKPGERRGGRKKGVPNKAGRELREVAQEHTPGAIKTLAEICEKGESEAARVAAANALLDRGHGKPTNLVMADVTQRPGQPIHTESISTPRLGSSRCSTITNHPYGSRTERGARWRVNRALADPFQPNGLAGPSDVAADPYTHIPQVIEPGFAQGADHRLVGPSVSPKGLRAGQVVQLGVC